MKFHLLLLAFVQGASEFLPISSSGHLAILEALFKFGGLKYPFTIYLHLATLLAILCFFFFEIVSLFKEKRKILYLGTSFPATVVVALLLKKYVLDSFENFYLIGAYFFITAIFLFLSDFKRSSTQEINFSSAMLIGFLQGFAVLPGISRSGITIAGGILLGIKRELAFKFSFLLAIPTMISAGIYERAKIDYLLKVSPSTYLILSFLLAFSVGLMALKMLRKFLLQRRMSAFGIYCCIIGTVSLFLGGLR